MYEGLKGKKALCSLGVGGEVGAGMAMEVCEGECVEFTSAL